MKQPSNINKFKAKKSLGQNFITDKNFLQKICELIPIDSKTNIIEIGPGNGSLTEFLIKNNPKSLTLIEKDRELAKKLQGDYKDNDKIKIKNEDALDFNYDTLKLEGNVVIVGNLPFNVSSQLLVKWLSVEKWPPFYSRMILMFQKEVAERIVSKHNNKSYGRLSVISQARCKVEKKLTAPAKIFFPTPKVDGMIIDFKPIINKKNVNFNKLKKILKKAFSQRRKKISTNLKEHIKIIEELNINKNLRAENISVEDYCKLANRS